jgi:hypothetical protein
VGNQHEAGSKKSKLLVFKTGLNCKPAHQFPLDLAGKFGEPVRVKRRVNRIIPEKVYLCKYYNMEDRSHVHVLQACGGE